MSQNFNCSLFMVSRFAGDRLHFYEYLLEFSHTIWAVTKVVNWGRL